VFLISKRGEMPSRGAGTHVPMPLPCFIPVSVVVGLVSGLVSASDLISLPFYLNYGLTMERLLATASIHSLFIQITKIATYDSVGVLSTRSVFEGVAAGSGAVIAIYITRPLARQVKGSVVPPISCRTDAPERGLDVMPQSLFRFMTALRTIYDVLGARSIFAGNPICGS
jgi:uncharacterized membrane protein YfcA